jgi:hypothetical protein
MYGQCTVIESWVAPHIPVIVLIVGERRFKATVGLVLRYSLGSN